MIGITLIWGGTFVVVQAAVERIPAFRYLAWRFAIATLVLIAAGGLRGVRRQDLRPGAIAGLFLVAGYALQTVGLQYTSASNAGFITGMFVVFTPLFVGVQRRRTPPAASLVGVVAAAFGLWLLAAPGQLFLSFGDALELGCAASFAAHILTLDRYRDAMPTLRFATLQLATVALVTTVWTTIGEDAPIVAFDATTWLAIAVTAILGSALAFFVQAGAQRIVPPTRTAIILTCEPVFAGIFGAIAGERIGLRGWLGAACILVGILIAELRARAAEEIAAPLAAPT